MNPKTWTRIQHERKRQRYLELQTKLSSLVDPPWISLTVIASRIEELPSNSFSHFPTLKFFGKHHLMSHLPTIVHHPSASRSQTTHTKKIQSHLHYTRKKTLPQQSHADELKAMTVPSTHDQHPASQKPISGHAKKK
jgi:hypothetical protein